jgi:alkylation response protein AidB-like acyl-CoA dehydrogenase
MSKYNEIYPWLRIERKFGPWLTSEEIKIVEAVRDYMQQNVKPKVWELEAAYHGRDLDSAWDTLAELNAPLVKMGLQKAGIPEAYGGLGLSLPCRLAIAEEMARVDMGFTLLSGKAGWLSGSIFASKNELLKKMIAKKVCSDDFWVATVCFTEPQGGVNFEDITQYGRTGMVIAKADGDDYVLNGEKIFPGPSGPPEFFQRKLLKGHLGYLVVANTEPVLENRSWDTIGLFYVPPDAKGLSFSTPYKKMGVTVDINREIYFDHVRIPKEYRVGGPGLDAALYFGTILAGVFLGGACRLVGMSAGLFDKAIENTSIREIEDRPLREYSLWAAIIGEMAGKIVVARAAYMYAAYTVTHPEMYGNMWDQDGPRGLCSGVRDTAGQAFRWVSEKTMDLCAAYGYTCESGVEKIIRDGQVAVISPGGSQRDKLDMALMFYPRNWSGRAKPFKKWP